MTAMVPAPPPTRRPPRRHVLAARVGLAAALLAMRLPLRWRITLARHLSRLPAATGDHAAALDHAIRLVNPSWRRRRVACLEISYATVLTAALTGRSVTWVLGARFLPHASHAWILTRDGAAIGVDPDEDDRPWHPVLLVPDPSHNKKT